MMNEFIEKWHNDKKYQAKIKLILYTIFVVIVMSYTMSLSHKTSESKNENNQIENDFSDNSIIQIPSQYNYVININIDDNTYKYYGNKLPDKENITKDKDNTITNYIKQDNEYYLFDNDIYVKTSKEEVYDIINYNYIDLDNINNYLTNSVKNGNQYLIYLKNIILNDDSEDYFIITINDNKVNIDYTPLMKRVDNTINNYRVDIMIENIE